MTWVSEFDGGAEEASTEEIVLAGRLIARVFPKDHGPSVLAFVDEHWARTHADSRAFFKAEEVLWCYLQSKPIEERPSPPFSGEYLKTLDKMTFKLLNQEEQAAFLFCCSYGHEVGVSASLVKGIAHVKVDDTHAPAPRLLK